MNLGKFLLIVVAASSLASCATYVTPGAAMSRELMTDTHMETISGAWGTTNAADHSRLVTKKDAVDGLLSEIE